jgi:hypothetical protein
MTPPPFKQIKTKNGNSTFYLSFIQFQNSFPLLFELVPTGLLLENFKGFYKWRVREFLNGLGGAQ